jgi:uncharacterized repeat protein (TIGR01451 family)
MSVSPDTASVGDAVQFNVTLRNGSTVPIVDLVLRVLLPTYLVPVNSTINGVPISPGEIIRGTELSGIGPGGTAELLFDAIVTPNTPDAVSLQALAEYRYPLYPLTGGNLSYSCGVFQRASVTSNTVTLTIYTGTLEINLQADQTIVSSQNPIVTYLITVINRGDFTVNDIVLTDPTLTAASAAGMEFIPGSVTVNGVSLPDASPIDGFNIGTLAPNARSTVTYQVRIAVNDERARLLFH